MGRTFTDDKGRVWEPRFTLATLRDMEFSLGHPLLATISDPKLFGERIVGSAEVVGKGLYFACENDALIRGVSMAEFLDGIRGPCIGPAAEAFYVALLECFPSGEEVGKPGQRPPASLPRSHGSRFMAWLRSLVFRSRGRTR